MHGGGGQSPRGYLKGDQGGEEAKTLDDIFDGGSVAAQKGILQAGCWSTPFHRNNVLNPRIFARH